MKKKICDKCGKERFIWKNDYSTGKKIKYCKQCYFLNKPSKINSVSNKRKKQINQYSKEKQLEFLKSNLCEINIPGVCTMIATEYHHTNKRNGDNLFKDKKKTCRKCHEWVHNNPIEAHELNLL